MFVAYFSIIIILCKKKKYLVVVYNLQAIHDKYTLYRHQRKKKSYVQSKLCCIDVEWIIYFYRSEACISVFCTLWAKGKSVAKKIYNEEKFFFKHTFIQKIVQKNVVQYNNFFLVQHIYNVSHFYFSLPLLLYYCLPAYACLLCLPFHIDLKIHTFFYYYFHVFIHLLYLYVLYVSKAKQSRYVFFHKIWTFPISHYYSIIFFLVSYNESTLSTVYIMFCQLVHSSPIYCMHCTRYS